MHHAQRAITGVGFIDHDAQPVHIDDLGQQRALAAHFSIDAVEMLFARLHGGADAGLGQRRVERGFYLGQELFLVAAGTL